MATRCVPSEVETTVEIVCGALVVPTTPLPARPLGARTQLTFFGEPITQVKVRPGTSTYLYPRDVGGAEYYQGYLRELSGREHLVVTGIAVVRERARSHRDIQATASETTRVWFRELSDEEIADYVASKLTAFAPDTVQEYRDYVERQ